ncbi:MAG: hypothetical protein A2541_02150 [Candidatus Taylorbacteria bacterium RIFOXYD2_FULL_36_9]|uniref:HicB-like antitoxin of toxin-antitoxin system domain-containing protein n=1 Tax=Candidatus Taylorbacteria bacterium RIFOXYD2_FULL_36_9 TaxID=1802338 RepID=A0A1G2PH11_9BACT|nr:MAG: hypothetical protein A2541_02150 [Candidatus Taylorbacteria bacterium RIFOXYD2_FULL_36_9]
MENRDLIYNLPITIMKQSKSFVAYCPILDISTAGKSEKDVKTKFVELVSIFIEELVEAGTLTEVLSELGWKKSQNKWTPPKVLNSKFVSIRSPLFA